MGKKILIIDDEANLLEMLKGILERRGYDVLVAESGAEGLHKAKKKGPDLIILDVGLPDIDGYEVCRTLKEEKRTEHIHVLMLTGKSLVGEVEKGFKVSADAYLIKPFDPERLLNKIETLLSK